MHISKAKPMAVVLGGVVLLCLVEFATAGPLDFLKVGRSVDADPNKEYTLQETDGPWMIFVASFSGPTARQDANILVHELRNRYKYNAFVFDKQFEHDLKKEGKPQNVYDRRKNFQKKGTVHEFAVLVGNFQSIDDKDFQKTLRGIKEIYPDCVKGTTADTMASQNFAELRKRTTRDETGRVRGPLSMTFGCMNPMLPPPGRGTVDKFIEQINAKSYHSLLECPGKYTIQIATFTGTVEYVQEGNNPRGMAMDKKQSLSDMEKGAIAAARLAKALRDKGYEAYEFHDYHASMVTVGSFDEIGNELPNGLTELRPEIANLMNQFKAKPADPSRIQRGAVTTISYEPVVIIDIECDPQPKIIEVPKRRR